jgi:transcriptional regulator with XRE-family HTH domain
MENISPQSKRLKEFVNLTGYSLNEFAKQCGIASVRTIAKIITEGATPTSKVLDKIITRFPQLNHDWVVLGYGEMIVKGLQTQETSINSLEKSSESSYQYIIQALRDHDFALNELSKAVEKANDKVDVTAQLVEKTSEQYLKEQKERAQDFLEKNDLRSMAQEKYVTVELEGIRNEAKRVEIENRALIERLDHERKERNQENFDKLSNKVRQHLEDSRKMFLQLIKEEKKDVIEALSNIIHDRNEESTKRLIQQMNDNAVKQTDFAIKRLLEKFSLKKLIPNLGLPDKVSNPKHQK